MSGISVTNNNGRSIWKIYTDKFDMGGTTVFMDRFGTRSEVGWIWDMDKNGYGIIGQLGKSGRDAIENAFGYAAQETAMTSLHVEEWEEDTEGTPWNIPVRLFRGSFGDTVGERATDLSTIPSYAVEEVSFMEYMSDGVKGGYRLLKKNPYLYADTGIGRHSDGRRLALVGFRCYSRLMDRKNIGIPEVEPHIIILLHEHWNLQGGTSFYPTRFDGEGYRLTWSVGIDHIVSKKLPVDIALGYSGSANSQSVLFSLAYEF